MRRLRQEVAFNNVGFDPTCCITTSFEDLVKGLKADGKI
jgi:hypothetical protein